MDDVIDDAIDLMRIESKRFESRADNDDIEYYYYHCQLSCTAIPANPTIYLYFHNVWYMHYWSRDLNHMRPPGGNSISHGGEKYSNEE